jgi:hypothetical protein
LSPKIFQTFLLEMTGASEVIRSTVSLAPSIRGQISIYNIEPCPEPDRAQSFWLTLP